MLRFATLLHFATLAFYSTVVFCKATVFYPTVFYNTRYVLEQHYYCIFTPCGKWYRVVVEAAECFMTRWHRDEAESSSYATQQRTPRVMTREAGGGKGGAAVLILLSTNTEIKW